MESGPHIAAIPEAIKAWIPERTNSAYQRPHEKDQRKEKGSWKRLTSIKRLKYFQKDICVVPSHDFVFSVRGEDRQTDWTDSLSFTVSSSPLSSFSVNPSVSLFSWWGFLTFCFPPFLFSHFLPLPSLAHFFCQYVCLPQKGDSAQRHTGPTGG